MLSIQPKIYYQSQTSTEIGSMLNYDIVHIYFDRSQWNLAKKICAAPGVPHTGKFKSADKLYM